MSLSAAMHVLTVCVCTFRAKEHPQKQNENESGVCFILKIKSTAICKKGNCQNTHFPL